MGTNYYLHQNVCEHCGRSDTPKHIGKSSAGWCFSLRIHPEDGIHDLPDWEREIDAGGVIKNEYGTIMSKEELMKTITERSWPHQRDWSAADMVRNHAVAGPNGLVRHAYGEVKHGAGTWDLCNYEFS